MQIEDCRLTHGITKVNELLYGGAVTTNRLGVRRIKEAVRKKPMQKRRLVIDIKGRIGIIRQDLSQLELIKSKEARNTRQQRLERKYDVRIKTLKVVIEEWKQRLAAYFFK